MSDLNGDLNSIILNLRSFAELDHFLFVKVSKAVFLPHHDGQKIDLKSIDSVNNTNAQVGFNSRYWLHCQWPYRPF